MSEYNSIAPPSGEDLWRVIGLGIPQILEVASPIPSGEIAKVPMGETHNPCSPKGIALQPCPPRHGWKVSPIGYWEQIVAQSASATI